MRTKTLLLTAALSAAGIATSMAQTPVYSVNAVGYVNTDLVTGFQIISNPLKATSNAIPDLFSTVADGTTVYKYSPASGFSVNSVLFGSWTDPAQTLVPGEGAFVSSPSAQKVTFVGEVPLSTTRSSTELDNALPNGFSLKSSTVPQAGRLGGDLKFPSAEGDTVYLFNKATQNYDIYTVLFGSWSPEDPIIPVGQGFFVAKSGAATWHVTFRVDDNLGIQ